MFGAILYAIDRSTKESLFACVTHLVSELQGQNPGEVVAFCIRWCSEEWCILRTFSFFKVIPHSGHWFDLSWLGVLS